MRRETQWFRGARKSLHKTELRTDGYVAHRAWHAGCTQYIERLGTFTGLFERWPHLHVTNWLSRVEWSYLYWWQKTT